MRLWRSLKSLRKWRTRWRAGKNLAFNGHCEMILHWLTYEKPGIPTTLGRPVNARFITGIWQSRTCFRKKTLCLGEVCFAKVVPLARTHRNSGVWICNPFSYEITYLITISMQNSRLWVCWLVIGKMALSWWFDDFGCSSQLSCFSPNA